MTSIKAEKEEVPFIDWANLDAGHEKELKLYEQRFMSTLSKSAEKMDCSSEEVKNLATQLQDVKLDATLTTKDIAKVKIEKTLPKRLQKWNKPTPPRRLWPRNEPRQNAPLPTIEEHRSYGPTSSSYRRPVHERLSWSPVNSNHSNGRGGNRRPVHERLSWGPVNRDRRFYHRK